MGYLRLTGEDKAGTGQPQETNLRLPCVQRLRSTWACVRHPRLDGWKSWPRKSRIEQSGQPRARDGGLNKGDLDRFLLIAIR